MLNAKRMDAVIRRLEDDLELSEVRRQHKGARDLAREKDRLKDWREKRRAKIMQSKSSTRLKKTNSTPELLHPVKTTTAPSRGTRRGARTRCWSAREHRDDLESARERDDDLETALDLDASQLALGNWMTPVTSQREGAFASERSARDTGADIGTQTGQYLLLGSDVVLTPTRIRTNAAARETKETYHCQDVPIESAVAALIEQARDLAARGLRKSCRMRRRKSSPTRKPRNECDLDVPVRDCYTLHRLCQAEPVLAGRKHQHLRTPLRSKGRNGSPTKRKW